jgi:peptidoglycan-associated lipoprotein
VLLVCLAALLGGCVVNDGGGSGVPQAIRDVTGAPAAGFENMQAGSEEDFMLNVGRRTYFTEGSAELDDTARTTLDRQAEWLNRNPFWKIKIQGFADDPGSAKFNVALSARRAEAVLEYLVSKGVPKERMWSKGYGQDRLVRDCPELACKSQNRRVISNLREDYES